MQFGYFAMPSHPPERPLKDGHEWDLQVIRWLDELGFAEAWIGEHHTAPWEPHPAPDLLVAQALIRPRTSASALAASCCPTITRPSSPTASPSSTTSRAAVSISASPPPACPATGRCSMSTACRASIAT